MLCDGSDDSAGVGKLPKEFSAFNLCRITLFTDLHVVHNWLKLICLRLGSGNGWRRKLQDIMKIQDVFLIL